MQQYLLVARPGTRKHGGIQWGEQWLDCSDDYADVIYDL
jgi:hypothetical protein